MKNLTKQKILNGVNTLADTVKVTLGTKGRLVLYLRPRDFEDPFGEPIMTKDGVTVAKQVESEDPVERMAIHVVRKAAENTVSSSGDGTSSTLVLAQEIINKGYELMEQGMSSYEFNRQADMAVEDIVEYIESKSVPVEDDLSKLKQVATISSNSSSIGELVHGILSELGPHVDIQLKKTKNATTSVEMVKGMKLYKGYFAPFFCNDSDTMQWKVSNCNVLLFDDTIRDYIDIQDYVKASVDNNGNPKPLLIYTQDVATTALNRIQGMMQYNPREIMIVEHDGFGDRRLEILNDVAIITGGIIVDADSTISPQQALGQCEEVIVDQKFTSILGGKADEEDRLSEINNIQRKLKVADLSLNEERYYKKRLANLSSGVAVIHVGGNTPVEMEEEYARIDDAVLAVKSAIRAGICPGGAVVWERAANYVHRKETLKNPQAYPAYTLVTDALRSILRQLLTNSEEIDKIDEIRDNMLAEVPKGYNLIDRTFYELDKYEVYDPASVLMDSIRNAVSVSKSILAVERTIVKGNVTI